MYPNIEGVFIDTGLEYPEIRDFVKTFDNITWIKPEKNFKQVINEYGYPFISKEIAKKYMRVDLQQKTETQTITQRNNLMELM